MNLQDYGWTDSAAAEFAISDFGDCVPARVIADYGSMLKIVTPEEKKAENSGRLQHFSQPADLPKVGDWVAVRLTDNSTVIEAVLPRKSEISRKATGEKAVKQVLAANVDTAFIVQALDNDFSPERLQRYLYQLSDAIQPVLILNKADKAEDVKKFVSSIENLNVPYIVCSARNGEGLDAIMDFLKPASTAVLLGSSGVGKSTITNWLLGSSIQKIGEVREADSKGRHTTSHRELFVLKNGALLIDTPGIRELQLWGSDEELDDTFDDIAEVIKQCQFRNCHHNGEPGCAVAAALGSGAIEQTRYDNYVKMKREIEYLQTKLDPVAAREKKKAIAKQLKQHYKDIKSSPKHRK